MLQSSSSSAERHCFLSGICPDEHCQTKLYFPSYDSSIECTNCGQRHPRDSLKSIAEVTDPDVALHNMVRNLLVGNFAPKKTTDSVKVLGLSNYHCKLLSPSLTHYGMDKQGIARPLSQLNQKDIFDCANLGNRAFLIQPEHIDIMGYGRDQTGSTRYLQNTLEHIKLNNGGEEVLIPIHADGDGHCLVHGISRALVGRELFWHALRTNLKMHFERNLDRYQALFHDFVNKNEWSQIIAESDPDYLPGPNEVMGLQNIHIFGLANVLCRPIILLDSLEGLQSSGDYSGVFLPVLNTPDICRGKDGKLNKPLCVAWSSSGRNHFIALVGVKGRPLPRLPRWMLTKAWGTPQEAINQYIEFDSDDMCTIGGERTLQEKYVQRLATAMESLFLDKHRVHPALVADVYNYIYKRTGIVGVHQNVIIQRTHQAVLDHQLYRCLICNAVSQITLPAGYEKVAGLGAGGELYRIATDAHGDLQEGRLYAFPAEDIQCTYDASSDTLVPDPTFRQPVSCTWCQGKQLRRIKADGSIVYVNGDRTSSPSTSTTCNCGHKHYWDGVEYDNPPRIFKVPLSWKGKTLEEDVVWFQNEGDPALNSNAFKIAEKLVQKHFPGEFGSEQLVQQVVETILQNTASKEPVYHPPSLSDMPSTSTSGQSAGSPGQQQGSSPRHKAGSTESMDVTQGESKVSPKRKSGGKSKEGSPARGAATTPSKIILTGTSKSLHKEELTMSETEKALRKRISDNASLQQQKKSLEEQAHQSAGKHLSSTDDLDAKNVADSKMEGKMAAPKQSDLASKTIVPPKHIKVRVSSSDGRQATLTLDPAITYTQLQILIESKLQVPPPRQKIKHGFPPKELRAPPSGDDSAMLPLRNGDKLTVEILPDPNSVKDAPHHSSRVTAGIAGNRQKKMGSSETGLDQGSFLREFQKGIERIKGGEQDNLEVQLSSHTLMAALNGMDLWTYSKGKPLLYERGGLFYNIVERDLGLEDGKHCMLPSIPDKRFRFSGKNDRLELCLEPLGHFPVSPEVDELEHLKSIAVGQRSLELDIGDVESNSRDGQSSSSGYVAFAGRGHSLSSDSSMDTQTESSDGVKEKLRQNAVVSGGRQSGGEVEVEVSDSGCSAIRNEVLRQLDDTVQSAESHIPDDGLPTQGEVEQSSGKPESAVMEEQSISVEDKERGASSSLDGGALTSLECTIPETGGVKCQEEEAMDLDEQREPEPITLSEQTSPLPMEVDSTTNDDQEKARFNFSPTPGSSQAQQCKYDTERVSGPFQEDQATCTVASANLLLPSSNTIDTSGAIDDKTDASQANETTPVPAATNSQPPVQSDSLESGTGSNTGQTTQSANQEDSYVSRRLGPGYTVLVKRNDEVL